MTIRNYDPTKGQAFQGDVMIAPLPADIPIDQTDEIKPIDGRLIIQEGELTGHHHHVTVDPVAGRTVNFRRENVSVADPLAGASPDLRRRLSAKAGTVRMFRDRAAADAMVKAGILDRADLCVGFMLVEDGSVVVRHQEHDGIRVPTGRYYIGRQIESAGAEERRVED